MSTIQKYRVSYKENDLLSYHEELSKELIDIYISGKNNIEVVSIDQIIEDIPNFYKLRVIDLLHHSYQHYYPSQISKIDIRKHLKDNIVLKKFISNIIKGRPDEAIYCLKQINEDNSVTWLKIAKIQFTFELDEATMLCKRRTETLSFYNENDEIDNDYIFIISDEHYNFFNEDGIINYYDTLKMAEESQLTLNAIINDLKMKVNAILMQIFIPQGKNYFETKEIGAKFFLKYNSEIQTYISTGSFDLRDAILNDTEFTWLDVVVASNLTFRDIIVDAAS